MKQAMFTTLKKQVQYPTTDGKPMAETDVHYRIQSESRDTLAEWFKDDPWTYVSGSLLVYYVKGNPRKHLAPDLFVVRNVPKLPPRELFLIWNEKQAPQVTFEITSKSTAREDLGEKLRIYRDLWRVREYFLFDPQAEYLDPPLQGYRLRGQRYVRMRLVAGRLPSEVLSLHVEGRGERLRFFDPARQAYLLTANERVEEAVQARQLAEAQAVQEARARQQAEAKIERLRRELDALRRQTP